MYSDCKNKNRTFSLRFTLWGSWMQVALAFKGRCFGVLTLRCSFSKLGCQVQTIRFSGRSSVVSGPLTVGGCLSLSCFDVGFFSFAQCLGVSYVVFGFLSGDIVLCIAVDSVCPLEMSPPASSSPASPSWTITLVHRVTVLESSRIVSRVQVWGFLPCLPTSWVGKLGLCQMG